VSPTKSSSPHATATSRYLNRVIFTVTVSVGFEFASLGFPSMLGGGACRATALVICALVLSPWSRGSLLVFEWRARNEALSSSPFQKNTVFRTHL